MLRRDILQQTSETATARHVAMLANGDVIVGGNVGSIAATRDFPVYRIDGATGAVE